MRLSIISAACIFGIISISQAAVIHVPADQTTIQAGIDAATSGDTVLVAAGTYTGPGNRDIDYRGKSIVVKSASGAALTIIDCQATEIDRHRAFTFHDGEDQYAVLDGFTIQGGVAPWFWEGSPYCEGGAIICRRNSNPTIRNNVIRNNKATGVAGHGGAIEISYSSPVVRHNVIEDNEATSSGGGIDCNGSEAIIRANTIRRNSADYGGGIECGQGNSPAIMENTIVDNTAASGAGIRCDGSWATIEDNTIERNVASSSGGGVYFAGQPPYIHNNRFIENSGSEGGGIAGRSDAVIEDNLFDRNQAFNGGGVSSLNADPEITNNNFTRNQATFGGGGMLVDGGSPTIKQNSFIDNESNGSGTGGGGIYCRGNSTPVIDSNSFTTNFAVNCGGGVSCVGVGTVTISNNSFLRNHADDWGGGIQLTYTPAATISNNSFQYGSARVGGGICCFDSYPTISGNLIADNIAYDWGGGINLVGNGGTSSIEYNRFINNSAAYGGGLQAGFALADLRSNTFYANASSGPGSGIHCDNGSILSVERSIISFGNGSAAHAAPGAVINLACSDIFGNSGGDWIGNIAGQLGINGNVSADPQFCDAAGGDFQIWASSPCVPIHNSCGELIGAEGIGCYTCADANADGEVTAEDYTYLLNYYFYYLDPPALLDAVDMDCDGHVRLNDVIILGRYIRGVGPLPCCASSIMLTPPDEPTLIDFGQ